MRHLETLLLSLLVLLFAPAGLLANPVLTCDPYPATGIQPTGFVVVLDEVTTREVPAKKYPDGSLGLWYDIGEIADGIHTVKVKAVKAAGKSAPHLESAWTTFSFRKTGSQIVRVKEESEKLAPTRTLKGYLRDER